MRRTLSWAAGSLLTTGLLTGPITAATADTATVSTTSAVSPASPVSCYYTVLEQYPEANPAVVEQACMTGAEGGTQARHACYFLLRNDYVPAVIALEACKKAPTQPV